MIAQVFISCLITLAVGNPITSTPLYENPPDGRIEDKHYETKLQPYSFSYDVRDEFGSSLTRKEDGDELGNRRGSYGYTDPYGISRQVDYIADENGFRAVVRTNEPGTVSQNPANVEMISDAAKYQAPSNYENPPVSTVPPTDRPVTAYDRSVTEVHEAVPIKRQLYIPVSTEPSSLRVIPVSYNSIANQHAVSLKNGRLY